MRVLLLNSRLSNRGGAHRWLLDVLGRLQGWAETRLAVGSVDHRLPRQEMERIGPWSRVKGLDRTGLRGRGAEASARRLREEIATFRPDVVHVNDVVDPDLLDLIADSGRALMMVQDHRVFCPGRGKVDAAGALCQELLGEGCARCFDDASYGQLLLDLTRRRLQAVARMSCLTVLSGYMGQELAAAGVPARKILCLPPSVEPMGQAGAAPMATPPGGYHLLAGRLSAHKGVEVAWQAARSTGLPLVVAGDGPMAGQVAQQAQQGDSNLFFHGWADRGTLGPLLAGARSLWLPSLWAEPFGIVGLEALSMGVPVVASDVGGVRDWLVSEHSGLLVPPGSPEELSRAAGRLGDDPSLAARLGRNGQRRVARDFAPQRQVGRLLKIYQQISCRRGP